MHECEASAQSPLKDMWRSLLEKDLILAEPLTIPQELATRSVARGARLFLLLKTPEAGDPARERLEFTECRLVQIRSVEDDQE